MVEESYVNDEFQTFLKREGIQWDPRAPYLRQQTPETVAAVTAQNYRPRGVGPKELLTGQDVGAYAPWEHGIKEKLRTDAVMYTNQKDRVNYALQQTTQPIFQQISSWARANEDTLTREQLFNEIKQYMGINWLASVAKKELNVIVMKNTESVNTYYHRIFVLWEHADTPMDERVDKLIRTMKPSITQPLLGHKFNTINELLDAARGIEDLKKNINSNFPKQDRPSKPSRNWTSTSAGPSRSTITSGNYAGASGSGGPATASGGSVGAKEKSSETNVNAKFIPTSVKPVGWSGPWFEPEKYPKKLQNQDRITLAREGRCWGCRGSGHRGNDECCPSFTKRLNVGRADADPG